MRINMEREKELGRALNKLISQIEEAIKDGSIYTAEFQDYLDEARKVVTEEEETEVEYNPSPGFLVINQE